MLCRERRCWHCNLAACAITADKRRTNTGNFELLQVKIAQLTVQNKGWRFEPVDRSDVGAPEVIRIRGFNIRKLEQRVITFDKPGDYLVLE